MSGAGRLIVLEGTDGSGKSTQYQMLCAALRERGAAFHNIVFPRYGEPSSALCSMYLQGAFGTEPDAVNPHAASVLYSVDRFASFRLDWGECYNAGGLILADRYTTSNAVHQGAKLSPGEREAYFEWLFDFEYNKMELPAPDQVILLDLPVDCALARIAGRERTADIHERSGEYLTRSRDSALHAARRYGWTVIDCAPDGKALSPDEVHRCVIQNIRLPDGV